MEDFGATSPIFGNALLVYRNPDGSFGWTRRLRNTVTIEGVNWLLETGFRGGTQATAIYAGLITDAGYSAASTLDTHASHAGWNEWTSLASATRPIWVPQAASGGNLGTSVTATFNFTSSGTIRGAFLSTIDAVGSVAAGVLYNTVIASAGMPVSSGGSLDLSPSVHLGE